jgi:hypothetical protein
MSTLLVKYKLQSVHTGVLESNCQMFTNIMKGIVEREEKRNGYFAFGPHVSYYSVNCEEFYNFVKVVNGDANNKAQIDYNPNIHVVSYIQTNIDARNDIVTYKLSFKSELNKI